MVVQWQRKAWLFWNKDGTPSPCGWWGEGEEWGRVRGRLEIKALVLEISPLKCPTRSPRDPPHCKGILHIVKPNEHRVFIVLSSRTQNRTDYSILLYTLNFVGIWNTAYLAGYAQVSPHLIYLLTLWVCGAWSLASKISPADSRLPITLYSTPLLTQIWHTTGHDLVPEHSFQNHCWLFDNSLH